MLNFKVIWPRFLPSTDLIIKHVIHSDKSRELRGPFLSAVVLTEVMLDNIYDNMKGSLKMQKLTSHIRRTLWHCTCSSTCSKSSKCIYHCGHSSPGIYVRDELSIIVVVWVVSLVVSRSQTGFFVFIWSLREVTLSSGMTQNACTSGDR